MCVCGQGGLLKWVVGVYLLCGVGFKANLKTMWELDVVC